MAPPHNSDRQKRRAAFAPETRQAPGLPLGHTVRGAREIRAIFLSASAIVRSAWTWAATSSREMMPMGVLSLLKTGMRLTPSSPMRFATSSTISSSRQLDLFGHHVVDGACRDGLSGGNGANHDVAIGDEADDTAAGDNREDPGIDARHEHGRTLDAIVGRHNRELADHDLTGLHRVLLWPRRS
jgi:hypothetical protein